jgi:predicted AAA+ superfamily ATPase
LIDERKRQGDLAGHYLLLGSSSKILLQSTSDSLAGRINYVEISGFNIFETEEKNLDALWVRGGFPDSYLAENIKDSFAWRQNLIRTYLERELPILGYQISSQILRRFLGMLAHYNGELFNASKIASSLGVSVPTIFRYLNIFNDLFVVRSLEPWSQNIGKRLVKTPKTYFRDTGLLHCLLNLSSLDEILSHPVAGGSWEGFVIENFRSVLGSNAQLFFYRTAAGAEMDLIVEFKNQLFGVEIKRSMSPTLSKGGVNAIQDLNLKHTFLVYPGADCYKLAENVTVTPLAEALRNFLM